MPTLPISKPMSICTRFYVQAENPSRQLLALLSHSEEVKCKSELRNLIVYLHGFPDMAVHPVKNEFASRMPRKLAQHFMQRRDIGVVAYNSSGILGSDREVLFFDKRLSIELDDAVAVCEYVRNEVVPNVRIHVVGLSTGAILGSLLRDKKSSDFNYVASTITVIAGLKNLRHGISYDFDEKQRDQFDSLGYCWKEYYLPSNVNISVLDRQRPLSLDGETEAAVEENDREKVGKVYCKIARAYYDECLDSSRDDSCLNIAKAIAGMECMPPFLVIRGDKDECVPFENGLELYETADEPKTILTISNANHTLTNSKHCKKALQAIENHVYDGQGETVRSPGMFTG